MNDLVFRKVTGISLKSLRTAPVILKDYKRVKVKNAPYPAVYHCIGSTVDAILIYLQNNETGLKLDQFEDEGILYKKTIVTVDHNGPVQCYCYVWANGTTGLELGKEWDYNYFVTNDLEKWIEIK